jgi:hypothetical protein
MGEIEMMRGAEKGKGRGIVRDDIALAARQRLPCCAVAAYTIHFA